MGPGFSRAEPPRRLPSRRDVRWWSCQPWRLVPELSSDLRRELVEQIRVRLRIDLALQQLGGRAHRNLRNFLTQRLTRTGRIQLDALVRGLDQALPFRRGGTLRVLHHVVGAVLRLINDLVGALARLADD